MNIPGLTTQSLLDLHGLIRHALEEDDRNPETEKKYGVRIYPDWRKQADAIEAELSVRKVPFTPIPWS